MPDISQIVPLAKILNVSSDKLLGMDLDEESEIIDLREKIGCHKIAFSADEAKRVYGLAHPFFEKRPTNPEAAFWCLESLSVLIADKQIASDRTTLIKECTRYENCISRYETNSDMVFKSYYVLARCYNLLGETNRSEEIMEKIPSVFGDRAYWEAEFAYADNNMDLAKRKCKESFHDKARYISRCIRMIRMISVVEEGEEGRWKQLKLNEYMLNIINAFLSGGDYLPHRMVYQKMALLSGMVKQYVALDMIGEAFERMNQLIETRNMYTEFMRDPESRHCLMFPEDDDDGIWHVTPERIEMYVKNAFERLESVADEKWKERLEDVKILL